MEEQYDLHFEIKILKKREQNTMENYLLWRDRNSQKVPEKIPCLCMTHPRKDSFHHCSSRHRSTTPFV